MNIISFDIEEWYIEKEFYAGSVERYRLFDSYLHQILDILDDNNLKATFFCVGRIATDFPYVVRLISDRGHEIGCHSNKHLWITKMEPEQFRADTKDAISALQDVCGLKVISYRAPAFSIGENNKWAIDILVECGIERDASIFPAKRDFGGFNTFSYDSPILVEHNGNILKEFPIGLANIFGVKVAYSGGGYFRFFPYGYVKRKIQISDYSIVYFHIGDLVHENHAMLSRAEYENYFKEKGTLINRAKRYIKSSIGTKGAFRKMEKLVTAIPFINLQEADKLIDWRNTPIAKI